MILVACHYLIGSKPGSNLENADGLSRLHLTEAPGHVPMSADVVLVMNHCWGFKNCLIPRYGRLLPPESIPS